MEQSISTLWKWFLSKLEDWPKLDFERNVIEGTPDMIFTTAKTKVLEVIKSIQEKMYMSQSRVFTDTTAKRPEMQSNMYMNSQ